MADGNIERETLIRLMTEMRPRLHRYCARMVGSAVDGEDVVQEALTDATVAFPTAAPIEHPESWLFRIAHNAALDALRRRRRRAEVEADVDVDLENLSDASVAADSHLAATASLALLLRLPVVQRSSVVLMDVLGHSLAATSDILGVSISAVKAALHRARIRLRTLASLPEEPAPALSGAEIVRLRAYADRFNARDFDALRNLLAEDVRLDLANRTRLAGRKDVSVYFGRYDEVSDWFFSVGVAEGRPALLVRNPADAPGTVRYVVLLEWAGDRIALIRDFKYAPYIAESLIFSSL